jgi:predicted amidohydrolase
MRVAAIQLCSGTEPAANLDTIEVLAEEGAATGAQYMLTPEVSIAFAENREALSKVAEPFEGNSALARLGRLAKRLGVYFHLGSLAVALPSGKFANRSVLFAPDGEIVAVYDKIHLFDADPEGDKSYRESASYEGGETAVTAQLPGVRLGLTICYDLRFPALYAALADDNAELIAAPSAFTVPTGKAHWEVLLRARAIETGSFVIAAAQGGSHENGRRTWGHSMIVSPWGDILAEIQGDHPGVITAEIDTNAVREARRRVPALANRRRFSLSVNSSAAE